MSLDVMCGRSTFPLEQSCNCYCFSLRRHDRRATVPDRFVMVQKNGKVIDFDYESVLNRSEAIKKAASNLHNCLSKELLVRNKEYDDVMSMILPITQNAALGNNPLTLEDIDRVNYVMRNVMNSGDYNSE